MDPRRDSGKTGGVVKLLYALLFPRCILWEALKGLGLRSFGWLRGPGGGWNFSFRRHFHDWELEEVQGFLATVNSQSISPNLSDRIWWKKEKNGSFSVKTCFDLLEGGSQQSVPIKMLWNPIVPTKVGFFAWEVWWGNILTMDQLKKRGFSLASRCVFCGKDEESLEHLLIHCQRFGACGLAFSLCLEGGGFALFW